MKVTISDIEHSINYIENQLETSGPSDTLSAQLSELNIQLKEAQDAANNNRPTGKPVNRYSRKTNVSA